ncbi:hypothetical protein SAMN04488577_0925 [Bacillus sp. cl95]|nr:hypothetical protein SAMN02799634_101648 [Bacillus sp. UNCCL13]SFQ67064.1 hypothetical protein SAMN04488577_0925 [Bacillus sp. cl95]
MLVLLYRLLILLYVSFSEFLSKNVKIFRKFNIVHEMFKNLYFSISLCHFWKQ